MLIYVSFDERRTKKSQNSNLDEAFSILLHLSLVLAETLTINVGIGGGVGGGGGGGVGLYGHKSRCFLSFLPP